MKIDIKRAAVEWVSLPKICMCKRNLGNRVVKAFNELSVLKRARSLQFITCKTCFDVSHIQTITLIKKKKNRLLCFEHFDFIATFQI